MMKKTDSKEKKPIETKKAEKSKLSTFKKEEKSKRI